MNKKNCIIVHGCPDDKYDLEFNKHWLPWTKKELEKKGIQTQMPIINFPWEPKYENFKEQFEKCDINEKTVLIGHSCGCAFLVRWLGESKQKISKLILVAPRKIPDNEIKRFFYNYDINPRLTKRVNEIVMFTSNNEEKNGKDSLLMFHDVLGGRIISLDNHGHYCFSNMGTEKFPELLEIILD